MTDPEITSGEFEQLYAERSKITVEELRAWGRVVVRCKCGEEGCKGWASLNKDLAEDCMKEMPGYHGYRYPKEGE